MFWMFSVCVCAAKIVDEKKNRKKKNGNKGKEAEKKSIEHTQTKRIFLNNHVRYTQFPCRKCWGKKKQHTIARQKKKKWIERQSARRKTIK